MKKFNLEEIMKDPISLAFAREYDKHDHIESIDIQRNDQGYQIESKVNIFGNENTCYIYLDQDENIISYQCSCEDPDLPCSHIGTTLLKLNSLDIVSIPYHYQYNKEEELEKEFKQKLIQLQREEYRELTNYSRELIEAEKGYYRKNIMSLIQNEKYEIIPTIQINRDSVKLSYQVGNDKKYVIKDVTDFLDWINNKEFHKYGKSLQFVHSLDAFDDFALKQIGFMEQSRMIITRLYRSYNYYYYNDINISRTIPLLDKTLDIFFETYQDYQFDNCVLKDIDSKIRLNIDEDDYTYTLYLDDDETYTVSYDNLYIVKVGTKRLSIDRLKCDEEGKVCHLIHDLKEESITIMKEDFPDFYKYVLMPIIDYIDIEIPIDINQNSFDLIRLYGDLNDDDQIYFKLYYIDENNNRITGFNKEIITNYDQDLVEHYVRQYAFNVDMEKHIAYFDINDEKTYEFINDGLDFLRNYAEIYVSEALKNIGKTAHYHISVGVKIEHDLLKLDIESVEIPKGEMAKVLEQYKRRKKFYRLKNGELLYLNSPQLAELEQFMDEYHLDLKDITGNELELNKNRMFAIENDSSSLEYIELDRKDSFKNQLDKFYHVSNNHYPIPYQYENVLRDYQKEGFIWLRTLNDYGFNGILADDMGLGKTLQVIALIESLHSKRPSIVVCPTSLVYNWEEEVHKFTENIKIKCIVGNVATRQEIIKKVKDYQLVVTSYDYMRRDYTLYDDITFNYVILDEAQYIKNQKTQNAKSVKSLKAKHKLALTGTPIENTLAELWSIFDFLMPQYLYNYHYFRKNFETDIVKNHDSEKTKKLQQMVSPFILRRNKKEVLTELPDKIEKTQIIPFNEEESQLYYATLAQANKQLQEIFKMEHVDKIIILSLLTKLRQTCCEPRLLYENIENTSSKMKACMDLITNFKSNHQQVLLFSSFTTVLDLIEEELRVNKITYYKITGNTTKEDRKKYVEGFQNGDVDVFLISLKAGGTGLNLTAAQAVIHYDPWWNVSAQNQATDRAYRIGQEKNVLVYKLVMKDSIEEKIIALQEKKKELADVFVENNEGSITNMSKEEILELFS